MKKNNIAAKGASFSQRVSAVFNVVIKLTVSQQMCLNGDTPNCNSGWDYKFGKCYKKFGVQLTRNRADEACLSKLAYLALPLNKSENDYLKCLAGSSLLVWLNCKYHQGRNRWEDRNDEHIKYSNWLELGVPRTSECAVLWVTSDTGDWVDSPCDNTNIYICVTNSKPTTTSTKPPPAAATTTTTTPTTKTAATTTISATGTVCEPNQCGIFTCRFDGSCDYCSPNQCKNGHCKSVESKYFPEEGVFNFTCECGDYTRYKGPTCELADNPCSVKTGEKEKCKNRGACKIIEKPNKNDWVCVCPGELKRGQRKDCTSGKSEKLIKYEIIQKVAIAIISVPIGYLAIAWVIFCFWECYEIGELPDLEEVSDSSTSESSTDTEAEERKIEDVHSESCERNLKGKNSKSDDEPPNSSRIYISEEKNGKEKIMPNLHPIYDKSSHAAHIQSINEETENNVSKKSLKRFRPLVETVGNAKKMSDEKNYEGTAVVVEKRRTPNTESEARDENVTSDKRLRSLVENVGTLLRKNTVNKNDEGAADDEFRRKLSCDSKATDESVTSAKSSTSSKKSHEKYIPIESNTVNDHPLSEKAAGFQFRRSPSTKSEANDDSATTSAKIRKISSKKSHER